MPLSPYFAADGSTTVTSIGVYVKVATLLTRATALVDLDGGTTGFFRLFWGPTGFLGGGGGLIAEYMYGGSYCQINFANEDTYVAGRWLWAWVNFGGKSTGGGCINAQVWGPGGVTPGPGLASMSPGTPHAYGQIGCNLGWGVNLSGTYDDFPNAAGYEMATLFGISATAWTNYADTHPLTPPPTSDPSPTTADIQFLYLCHQSQGPVAGTVLDSGPYGFHLTPGPNGANIIPSGPY